MKIELGRFTRVWLFLILLGFSLQSCEIENLNDGKKDNAETLNQVSLNDAMRIAENIQVSKNTRGLVWTKSSKKRKIKGFKEVKENNQSLFYILNYENSNGFIILSGNKRCSPILAYSENGEFPTDTVLGGASEWYAYSKAYVTFARNDTTKVSRTNMLLWKGLDSQPIVPDDPKEPDYENPIIITNTYGPLLNTTWHQRCGYNNYCPAAADGPCGHALTGCVATAMAQIMRFHSFPSNYSWAGMPNNYGVSATAMLMSDVGVSVGMKYSGTESGIEWDVVGSRVVNSLINTFGYSSTVRSIDFEANNDLVKAEIRSRRPVFMRGGEKKYYYGLIPYYGGGHAWVCDGYQESEYVGWCKTLYLHMNWGWEDRSYNGWFAYNAINPAGYDFNYKVGCVIGIKP